MNYIFNRKIKFYTKEITKLLSIAGIAFSIIFAIILIKYKPSYKVSVLGQELGYVSNKEALEEGLKQEVIEESSKNIDHISINKNPEYEFKLVDRTQNTNEQEIKNVMQEDMTVTYKYYEVALNDDVIEKVDTIEEAEDLVNTVKEEVEEVKKEEANLVIVEKYTENVEEVTTTEIETAKVSIEENVTKVLSEEKAKKEEEERVNSLPEINGIKLAVVPVSGTISSRYGVSSRIRSSDHTGLDIAAKSGTPIKVTADGKVINASYSGAYGNLVKVDHGNGVETWYAHTSKMYVKVGQSVNAGDVIAAVGSTGNSTGPHLHLEIRVNGTYINPQKYLYN